MVEKISKYEYDQDFDRHLRSDQDYDEVQRYLARLSAK